MLPHGKVLVRLGQLQTVDRWNLNRQQPDREAYLAPLAGGVAAQPTHLRDLHAEVQLQVRAELRLLVRGGHLLQCKLHFIGCHRAIAVQHLEVAVDTGHRR